MMGNLYTVQEMPEQPKESFFKGLFGGGAKSLDREELCELNFWIFLNYYCISKICILSIFVSWRTKRESESFYC